MIDKEEQIRFVHYDEETYAILGFLNPNKELPDNVYKVDISFIRNVNNNKHTHVRLNGDTIESYKVELKPTNERIDNIRQLQYERQSDPLFMQWQFALATGASDADDIKQKWVDSVQLIKNNNPKG